MRDESTLCLSCFEETGGESPCPHCGRAPGDKPESPLFLAPGTRLRERYLVGQVLGHGGFGITYLAWDETFAKKVAIKEYLPKEIAMRGASQTVSAYSGEAAEAFRIGLKGFLEEARRVHEFSDQPYVIPVIDYFEENNTAYMVMRYLEGMTLHEYLEEKGGRLSYPLAEQILIRVLDGLRPLHEAGVLHRDVAPDNIYLTSERQIKLFDFGSARLTLGRHTRTLTAVVKSGYSPIEQYSSEGKQGPWTDIYATAATFYHALTGDKPPDAPDRYSPSDGTNDGADPLTPPSQLGVDIPAQAEQALLKALAVRGPDRFQDVESFQQAIQPHEPPPDFPNGPPPWPWRRVALGAILLVGGGLITYNIIPSKHFENVSTPEIPNHVSPPSDPNTNTLIIGGNPEDNSAEAEAEARRRAEAERLAELERRKEEVKVSIGAYYALMEKKGITDKEKKQYLRSMWIPSSINEKVERAISYAPGTDSASANIRQVDINHYGDSASAKIAATVKQKGKRTAEVFNLSLVLRRIDGSWKFERMTTLP